MTKWIKFNGSDEQIAELRESLAKNGFITSRTSGIRWTKQAIPGEAALQKALELINEYFIIPDDPLRQMKMQQSMTGQPVWWRNFNNHTVYGKCDRLFKPFDNPSALEYSFMPFKEEV